MAAEERELVPVASLEPDFSVYHVEEAAPAKAQRIAPFQDGPLPFFEDVFNDANHIRRSEPGDKHGPDRVPPHNRGFSDLMVDGLFRIETGQRIDICTVECFDPGLNEMAWLHDFQW